MVAREDSSVEMSSLEFSIFLMNIEGLGAGAAIPGPTRLSSI